METTDLRTEFTKETKTRFNTEWLVYNDYVDWLEKRLVKLLTIQPVIPSLQQDDSDLLFHECPNCNCRCNCTDQPCSCCNEA
jgi:hypothetical protein